MLQLRTPRAAYRTNGRLRRPTTTPTRSTSSRFGGSGRIGVVGRTKRRVRILVPVQVTEARTTRPTRSADGAFAAGLGRTRDARIDEWRAAAGTSTYDPLVALLGDERAVRLNAWYSLQYDGDQVSKAVTVSCVSRRGHEEPSRACPRPGLMLLRVCSALALLRGAAGRAPAFSWDSPGVPAPRLAECHRRGALPARAHGLAGDLAPRRHRARAGPRLHVRAETDAGLGRRVRPCVVRPGSIRRAVLRGRGGGCGAGDPRGQRRHCGALPERRRRPAVLPPVGRACWARTAAWRCARRRARCRSPTATACCHTTAATAGTSRSTRCATTWSSTTRT